MTAILPALGAAAHGPHSSADIVNISLALTLVLANELRLAVVGDAGSVVARSVCHGQTLSR